MAITDTTTVRPITERRRHASETYDRMMVLRDPEPDIPSWTFLTNHAHVLIAVSRDPELRQRDIAHAVGITTGAVQRILHELEDGGYLAREAARDLPDKVDRVITLGSPIIGGPKYTAAAPFFMKRGLDLDWIEQEVLRRESRPIQQPVTAIYSKSDAIVSWHATVDHHNENVEHIEVDAAHVGLAFNPTVWAHIIDALEA